MKKFWIRLMQMALLVAFAALVWHHFDAAAFARGWNALAADPLRLAAMTAAYWSAFWLKAVAWRLYLPKERRPKTALLYHGLIYSLLLNHVLPVKAGDVARVGVLRSRGGAPVALALQSVVAMRALDMAALALLAAAGAPLWLGAAAAPSAYASAGAVVAAAALGAIALRFAGRLPWTFAREQAAYARSALSGRRGAAIAALTVASWTLEAAVVLAAAAAVAGAAAVGPLEAVWANAFTIAGGPAYIGPGGIGGYESAMSFALHRSGLSWTDALAVALLSHGFKFAFSYAAGAVTWCLLPIRPHEWGDWLARRKGNVRWTE